MKYKVKASKFVERQKKGTGKTYSDSLSFSEIAAIAEEKLNSGDYIRGYRDGVVLIELKDDTARQFICPLIKIDKDTTLSAKNVQRRRDEEYYIQIRALNGKILTTHQVDLVLYRNDVLKETNEVSTNADWELIAFMAKPKGIKMPMGPVTMMRNQLEKPGGTKGIYPSDKWAESVDFWQQYAILEK